MICLLLFLLLLICLFLSFDTFAIVLSLQPLRDFIRSITLRPQICYCQ